jgi:hypothetical protein
MHLTSALAGSGVTTTQAFDPNTGLVQSILAGTSNSVSNQAFTFDTLGRLASRSWLDTTGFTGCTQNPIGTTLIHYGGKDVEIDSRGGMHRVCYSGRRGGADLYDLP